MRNWALVLGLLVACDNETTECAEGGAGGSSSGAVESSSSESGEESTGEPAAPTCGELLACYDDNCREIAGIFYGCTQSAGPTCNYQDARDFGSAECADAVAVDADAPSGYAACVSLALAECLSACGPLDFHAYELFRDGTGVPGLGNSYSGTIVLHCSGAS